ncbi:MAG: hypothetical protein EKK56_00960 [Flavobacteriaceae bacterium]|nr:MAG: hypothetical protein EKK56_00960 [Flavobacteriaceae bacterium]
MGFKIVPFQGFIGGYNTDISKQIEYEETTNMYVVQNPKSPEQQSFATLPGLDFLRYLGVDPIRPMGLFRFRDNVYGVQGSRFFEESAFIATIPSTTSQIWWATTSTQVTFTDGSGLYVYEPSTATYTAVSAPFIVDPGVITSINGRIVVPLRNTNQWFVSNINDATTYDENNYLFFTLRPDILVGSATVNSRLLLIGEIHTESWVPVASAGVPLNRDNNVAIDYGTWAAGSIIQVTEEEGATAVCWLARDTQGGAFFVLSEGTSAQKISTPQIDILLASFSNLEDCYGFSHRSSGHLFIEWNFPTANYTLVFDVNTKMWFFRKMLDGTYFIGNSHAYANGIHYVGSRIDGTLYNMSKNYFVYYKESLVPENIHRSRIGPIIRDPSQTKVQINYFEVKFQTGYIPNTVNPTCWLQTSVNNGPFGNARPSSIGLTGKYNQKSYWYGLGTNYALVPKIDIYDPIECYILGASYMTMGAMR